MNKEQMVEQRAKAVEALAGTDQYWSDKYRRIARAEIERESRLVDCLVSFDYRFRERAIKEWESEFAPPPRTLEQVAADVVKEHAFTHAQQFVMVPKPLVDELAALLPKGGA